MSLIRVIFSLFTCLHLEIKKLDINTTFLHGDLENEIYMEHPDGSKVKGKEDYVCNLKKIFYRFK